MPKKGNIPWNKGKKGIYSIETIEKLSKSVKDLWNNEEYKKNQEISRNQSDAYRNKGKKQSITMKKLFENPEMRLKDSEAVKKVFEENPQIIERMSNAKIKNWQDDNYRSMQKESRKNSIAYQNRKFQQKETLKETYNNHPEIKQRISQKLKQVYQEHPEIMEKQKKTRFNNSTFEERSNWARKAVLSSRKSQKSPSSIEKKLAKELEINKIFFLQQMVMLEKYKVDFLIEDFLVIECDGDYWHNLQNIKEKDKKRDEILEKNGFTVLRFWEHQINNDISFCINKIKSYISL